MNVINPNTLWIHGVSVWNFGRSADGNGLYMRVYFTISQLIAKLCWSRNIPVGSREREKNDKIDKKTFF